MREENIQTFAKGKKKVETLFYLKQQTEEKILGWIRFVFFFQKIPLKNKKNHACADIESPHFKRKRRLT
jgi:hypothetical protein